MVDWSIIDLLVESLLARLVRAPDFPMLAITKRLGADARNAALQALAEMHEQRYGGRALPSEAVAKVALIRKRLEAAGVDSPVIDARLLLERGAGVARIEIVTDPRLMARHRHARAIRKRQASADLVG